MAFSVEYIYQIIDKYSGPLDRISKKTQRFQAIATKTGNKINKMAGRMDKFANRAANLQTAIGPAAVIGSMLMFVKSASALDDKMADVQRSTGLAGSQLAKMRDYIEGVSIASGKSALNLSDIVYQGGKLGIPTAQMGNFLTTVMKTANAFDVLEGTAAEDIGKIRDNLGLGMKATERFMSQINYLADNVSANGANIIEIVKRTSGTMKMLNVPTDVIAGWAAFADQITVSPELAASGINMMMSRMKEIPGMHQKMIDDPKKSVLEMLKTLGAMPEIERSKKILKMFGRNTERFVSSAISKIHLLDKAFALSASKKALESMNAEWEIYLKRSSTQGKRVMQIIKTIGRTIGVSLIKTFDKWSDKIIAVSMALLRFVKTHPVLVKTAIIISLVVAGLVGLVVVAGVIAGAISALLPVLAAVALAIGATAGVVLAIVAIGAVYVAMFTAMYAKSNNFRMAISNLAGAFYPLWRIAKGFTLWIGKKLGINLGSAGESFKTFGDIAAVVINMIAAMVGVLTTSIERMAMVWGKILTGDIKGAYELAKTPIDFNPVALNEINDMNSGGSSTIDRLMTQKMELSGQINVSAQNGAKIESAEIGLPTGDNVALAYQ